MKHTFLIIQAFIFLLLTLGNSQRSNCAIISTTPIFQLDNDSSQNQGTTNINGIMTTDRAYQLDNQSCRKAQILIPEEITISLWWNLETFTTYQYLFYAESTYLQEFGIFYNNFEKKYQFTCGISSCQFFSPTKADIRKWMHFSIVINSDQKLKIYKDGVQLDTGHCDNQSYKINQVARTFYFGSNKNLFDGQSGYYWQIDEFQLYDKALTQRQILCLADKCDQECTKCSNNSDTCIYGGDYCDVFYSSNTCDAESACDWINSTCLTTACSQFMFLLPNTALINPTSSYNSDQNKVIFGFYVQDSAGDPINDDCFEGKLSIKKNSFDITSDGETTIDFPNKKLGFNFPFSKLVEYCIDNKDSTYNCQYIFEILYANKSQVNWVISQQITVNANTTAVTQQTIEDIDKQIDGKSITVQVDSILTVVNDSYTAILDDNHTFQIGELIYLQHQISVVELRALYKLKFISAKLTSASSIIDLPIQSEKISTTDSSSGWYAIQAVYPGVFSLIVKSKIQYKTGRRQLIENRYLYQAKNGDPAQGNVSFTVDEKKLQKEDTEQSDNTVLIIIAFLIGLTIVVIIMKAILYVFKIIYTTQQQKYEGPQQLTDRQLKAKEIIIQ